MVFGVFGFWMMLALHFVFHLLGKYVKDFLVFFVFVSFLGWVGREVQRSAFGSKNPTRDKERVSRPW